ncbi:MAG: hypothetical protein AAFP84_13090 [Actinomycetota bacterium]
MKIGMVLIPALVVASCSASEDATPSPAPTGGASTTTVAPSTTAATTTIATTTTEVATTVPSTTAAPTTTAAPVPTGDPTDVSTPVFAGSSGDAWLYLGRWTGSAWEAAFDDAGAPVPADVAEGSEVTIAELGQNPVSGTIGADGVACEIGFADPVGGPVISPNAGAPDEPGFGYRAVALPADWDVHPRAAVSIDDTIQAYADAGVAAFAGDAVETQAGEVDHTVVADLDGDGDTEVLVVFGHENEPVEGQLRPPGGFSALLLIDADSQAAASVTKSFTPLTDDGEPTQILENYRVLDVVDLNGDGISEVVVHGWYFEGAGVGVYSYDGSTLTEVLSAGCGA